MEPPPNSYVYYVTKAIVFSAAGPKGVQSGVAARISNIAYFSSEVA